MKTAQRRRNQVVKRKNIDIPEDTFKILSHQAVAQGTNLKNYIENLLEEKAEDMKDAQIYAYLSETEPEGKVMANKKEQTEFEKWLGL